MRRPARRPSAGHGPSVGSAASHGWSSCLGSIPLALPSTGTPPAGWLIQTHRAGSFRRAWRTDSGGWGAIAGHARWQLGLAFEDCCREWLGRYAPPGILADSEHLGSWWSRDGQVEIDVVGTTKNHYDLLASCK